MDRGGLAPQSDQRPIWVDHEQLDHALPAGAVKREASEWPVSSDRGEAADQVFKGIDRAPILEAHPSRRATAWNQATSGGGK